MSDRPLFENTDEQEAAYAPHQKAAGDPTARRDTDEDSDRGTLASGAAVVAPIVAAGSLGGGGAQGSLGSTSSPAGIPAGGPMLAGAALEEDIRNNEEQRD